MKVSFITTVLNEENSILLLLKSLLNQSKMPDEIVIVDGGSSDQTVAKIKNEKLKMKNDPLCRGTSNVKLKIFVKKGNRAVGRNEAVRKAHGDIIACSDAGCVLDRYWFERITEPFRNPKIDVVAGYYKGKPKSIFEECLVPYVLVMPDKINRETFLPASRSMAFKKSVWKRVGGFPKKYSHNEDYVFARKLKEIGVKIFFQKLAIAYWIPRKNIPEAAYMFYRFALGDAEVNILRTKVILLFLRYFIGAYLIFLTIIYRSLLLVFFVIFGYVAYVIWSIVKNYSYINKLQAIILLPFIQFTADISVMLGTVVGIIKRYFQLFTPALVYRYKSVSFLIIIYILLMLVVINWGIPNSNHPFTYHMDEWHQAQAVRTVFTQGSPNVPGSANGSMFHFFLSGIYLVPFIIVGIFNPFSIKSSIDSLEIQQKLFEILRLNTLLLGVFSVVLIAYIAIKYFKVNPLVSVFLFVVNPIWFSLSNYFKYDIALIFWLLLSLLFLFRYAVMPTVLNYNLAGFISALSVSVKISALPIIPIYVFAYMFFTPESKKHILHLLYGIVAFIATFLLFGIPDLIFGKGDIKEYLFDNLVRTPNKTSNFIFDSHYLVYLVTRELPVVFGRVLFYTFILALFFWILLIIRKYIIRKIYINKNYIFILISFLLFLISLLLLKIGARGNRLLVLLPFIALMSGIFVDKIFKFIKAPFIRIFIVFLCIALFFQTIESFAWYYIKLKPDPRETSSLWIKEHMLRGTLIGIENIPIYQLLPDVIVKEYYENQRNQKASTLYDYEIINNQSHRLPDVVVVTNEEVESKYVRNSSKKLLLDRLKRERYRKIVQFLPDFTYYKFFGNDFIFYFSNLIPAPVTVSIYKSIKDTH